MIDRESPSVRVRVWMLGIFQVERRSDEGTWEVIEKTAWEGSYARPLLKRLLCATGRRVARSDLLDDLWPNTPDHLAERYLNNATSRLRQIFHKQIITPLGSHGNGGYQLAEPSLLWSDIDACDALMREAERAGLSSAAALSFLEQASKHFERGGVLEGESGQWCLAIRTQQEAAMRYGRMLLAQSYESQHMLWLARSQYQALLEINPVDEDALCRLLAFLHRHGMTHDARACYEQAKIRFKEYGLPLSPVVTELTKKLTNESPPLELYLTPLPIPDAATRGLAERIRMELALSASSPSDVIPFAQGQQASEQDHAVLENDERALSLFPLSPVNDEQKGVPEQLVETPFVELQKFSALADPANIGEETLGHFEQITETCWYLSKGNDLETAGRVLWAYLPKLASLALPPSQQQQRIARIVSQGYLLAAPLAGHHNDLQARQHFSEQALLYGNVAQDRNLQIAALRQLAATFDYLDRPHNVLQTYQQTLPYLGEITPLLRARIYAGISGIYAQLGDKQEALRFLSLAYENFPDHPERDPSFLFADCGYFTLILWDGLNRLELHEPHEAEKAFERVDGLQSTIQLPERVRAEILNHQATTFTELRSLDQACDYLETAVKLALALGSKRRYLESLAIFTKMQRNWGNEQRVKNLRGFFRA